ncbi:MAG: hypothetical protein CM15mP74_09380 [Halieaceae bacterium]|nr:MAG: hypothetical protein CM15mP74_09380 [Halieaceae bacterium]
MTEPVQFNILSLKCSVETRRFTAVCLEPSRSCLAAISRQSQCYLE